MKKTIILSIIFCALFVYLPFAAQAESATVTAVSVTPGSLLAGNESTIHDIEFTTTGTMGAGFPFWFTYVTESMGIADFNCDTAVLNSSDFGATLSCVDVNFALEVGDAVSAGTYSFQLELTNASTAGTYQLMGYTNGSYTDGTASDTFTLTGEGDANPISSVIITNSSLVAGTTNNMDVAFEGSFKSKDTLTFIISAENVSPADSGFDFSTATFTSDTDGKLSCAANSLVPAIFQCTSSTDLVNGTYTISAAGVTNTSTPGIYTGSLTIDSLDSITTYTSADPFTITALTKPKKFKKKQIKIKNKKKKSAKLWCKARATATKYQFVLEKKKANKKGYKQVKKWKNVPTNYKIIKKKKNLLKSKTKFRFKARPGNAAGWAKWGPYKAFTMK